MRVGLLQESVILQQCFECFHVQELPEAQPCEECGGSVDILRFRQFGRTINYTKPAIFTAE